MIAGLDTTPTASPEIHDLVNSNIHQDANALAGQYSGNNQSRGLLNREDNFNSQLAYGDRAQSDAIRKRWMGDYARYERELDTKNLMAASKDKVARLQQASDLASQEVEQNFQKEVLKHRMDQARKQARGAVLGSVLGIVGGVGGAVAGGPAGAMAGMAAGEGVGQMMGNM